jgi:zona occludens toxin (predicted ATPase)
MRIESGLSSYSYQSRHVPSTVGAEDAAPETANTPAPRASGASTFSSTLLSNQLASALWTVEGARKAAIELGSSRNRFEETSRIQAVEAAYREYEIPPSPYQEF